MIIYLNVVETIAGAHCRCIQIYFQSKRTWCVQPRCEYIDSSWCQREITATWVRFISNDNNRIAATQTNQVERSFLILLFLVK